MIVNLQWWSVGDDFWYLLIFLKYLLIHQLYIIFWYIVCDIYIAINHLFILTNYGIMISYLYTDISIWWDRDYHLLYLLMYIFLLHWSLIYHHWHHWHIHIYKLITYRIIYIFSWSSSIYSSTPSILIISHIYLYIDTLIYDISSGHRHITYHDPCTLALRQMTNDLLSVLAILKSMWSLTSIGCTRKCSYAVDAWAWLAPKAEQLRCWGDTVWVYYMYVYIYIKHVCMYISTYLFICLSIYLFVYFIWYPPEELAFSIWEPLLC